MPSLHDNCWNLSDPTWVLWPKVVLIYYSETISVDLLASDILIGSRGDLIIAKNSMNLTKTAAKMNNMPSLHNNYWNLSNPIWILWLKADPIYYPETISVDLLASEGLIRSLEDTKIAGNSMKSNRSCLQTAPKPFGWILLIFEESHMGLYCLRWSLIVILRIF